MKYKNEINDKVSDDTLVIGTLNKKRRKRRKKNGLDKTITIDTNKIKDLDDSSNSKEYEEVKEDKELALEQTSSLELEEITRSLKVLDSTDYSIKNIKKQREVKIIIQLIIIIFLLLITFFVTYFHITNRNDNKTSYVNSNVNITDKVEYLSQVSSLNPDIVGYLEIPDTNISYPVLFSNSFDYSNHDMYHNSSEDGSVYIDKYNSIIPRDTNLLIYAHSSKENSLFYDLNKYKDKDYYLKHKTLKYYTLNKEETYEVISVFNSLVYEVSDNDFKYYKFYKANEASTYDYYINNIKERSLYNIDISANFSEDLLTLSTLEYSSNGRIVVVFKKIK